jgi:hypothetical protein
MEIYKTLNNKIILSKKRVTTEASKYQSSNYTTEP